MFRKVMVPLDGSALAEQALGQAAAIASAAGAELDLLLVHEPIPLASLGEVPWENVRWSRDEHYLDTLAAEIASGASVSVTRAVLEGPPADTICRRIADADISLVVMTTHGRTGLSRAWIGSTADRVLRHSSVPVLMLHPVAGKTRAAAARHLFKRILVALDGSSFADEILSAASALCECGNGRLLLTQVVQPVPLIVPEAIAANGDSFAGFPPMIVDTAATRQLAADVKAHLAATARTLQERHIECEIHVPVAEHVARAILDTARATGADAIALTTRGRGASRLFMGSVADKVLRGGGLPTLLQRTSVAEERSVAETAGEATEVPATAHA